MSKKTSIRVGVRASDGSVSGKWKIWAKNNEIYLLDRAAGELFKASLHQSGNWQISLTSEFIADKKIANQNRHIERWKAPIDNICKGVMLAFRIIIPESELRKPASTISHKNINWINSPKKGDLAEIDLILTKPNVKVSNWPGKNSMQTSLLKEIKLLNEDTLWIVYRYQAMDRQNITQLDKYREDCLEKIKEGNPEKPKAILIGDEKDGSRKFIELSLL
ncbi:hypothetical protein [Methanobacterium sp.]|uniref:hypothetical protein n=1 Tax=Methanobacterium sp. TaxID=2164 RepID=UPI0025E39AF6|nr:hypothetical protein [Methanobacterium sp.]MBI5459002.1 hypothetical protein [Methanobacterium sp.]